VAAVLSAFASGPGAVTTTAWLQIEDRRESWSADQQQKRQDLFHIFVSQWILCG